MVKEFTEGLYVMIKREGSDMSVPNLNEAINDYIRQFGIDMPENAKEIIDDYSKKAWEQGKLSGEINTGKVTDRMAIAWFTKTQKFDFGKVFGDYEQEMFELVQSELKGHVGKRDDVLAKAIATKLNAKMTEEKLYTRYGLVMANATNKARNYSRVLEYEKLDFYEIEIVAIIDQKTSRICKEMNGRRIEIKIAAQYVREVMSTDPDKVVEIFPWPKEKDIPFGGSTQEILDKCPCKLPPYHGHCRTSALVSLRGTSIKEAAKALNDIGIKDVDFGNTKNMELVNNIVDGLYQVKNYGLPLPQSVKFSESLMIQKMGVQGALDIPAAFLEPLNSPNGKSMMLINDKNDYWKKMRDESFYDGVKEKGVSLASTDKMYHVIFHESAHNEHYQRNEPKYRRKITFQNQYDIDLIKNDVSELASMNNRELVAEMRVGLLYGKKYKDELMEFYRNFGGIE